MTEYLIIIERAENYYMRVFKELEYIQTALADHLLFLNFFVL